MRFCDVDMVRFEAAIPPQLDDEAVWAAVERYREGIFNLAAIGAPVGRGGSVLCGGDPAVMVVRHREGRATHTLDVACPRNHYDLLTHELSNAVVEACPPPPGFQRLPGDGGVDAADLGAAIGPGGATIKRIHPRAKLLWDTDRPLFPTYARWVPTGFGR